MAMRFTRPLILLLCFLLSGQGVALAASSGEVSSPSSVHEQVARRGVGHGVRLVCADGSEVKGRIVAVRETSVDVQSQDATAVKSVQYEDVAKVKGVGLSTGAKVGVGVGVGVLICAGIAAIVIHHEVYKRSSF